jgi:type I restriction enzyme, R subunit
VLVSPYNEADTRAKLIDPALKRSGWGESHIEREHYFVKGKQVTNGRIFLVGNESRRRAAKKVDYLLRYYNEMIAVLEAKDETQAVDSGLGQAREYAELLNVPFAYSSNGHGFSEYDYYLFSNADMAEFPAPDALWDRWALNRSVATVAADPRKHPLLHPPCPVNVCGKELRYYQESAVRSAIERMMRSQRRILLTLATGTGKTHIAFQIAWKLRRSGWLTRPILFLADRRPLRSQAYNAFGPFALGVADPREVIEGAPFNPNREIYFGLYQTLDAGDRQALFETIPPDFFGLIIIDECHRSGFGKWNRILQHFPDAIQLGMTATPKRDENVDTYAYFCSEEPELPVDPSDPTVGPRRSPAYVYSLGQGIDDGFLATYKIHKVRTSIDKSGLHLDDAQAQGAEIYVPENVTLREVYETAQFEREITLPDRTATIVGHLANLLRTFGPMERTMVFCVDQDHARLAARLLQNLFADLGLNDYAVPIISDEGEAENWLERFQDSDARTPVVATTAELLSTGVDVPSCKNIVFMKPLSSVVLFKQIVGRGARIDAATGKEWFRIIDDVNASRLFDDWDRASGERPQVVAGERTSEVAGVITDADSGALLVGATVTVLVGPNLQVGPVRTDEDGTFQFDQLPAGTLRVQAGGPGYISRTISVETAEHETTAVVIELRTSSTPPEKVRVRGIEVTIAEEATFLIEATGEQLSLQEYLDYAAERVSAQFHSHRRLRDAWVSPTERAELFGYLEEQSVQVPVLVDLLGHGEADDLDLLTNIVFGRPIRTKKDRVEALLNEQQAHLNTLSIDQREVLSVLLTKYELGGIGEIFSPEIYRLSPFREMGQAPGVSDRFGGPAALRAFTEDLAARLYRDYDEEAS